MTLSAGTGAYAVSVPDTRSNKIKLLDFGGGVPTGDIGLYTADWGTTFGSGDYTYNASTGLLTILLQDDDERLNATGTRLTVFMDGVGGDIVWADDGELTLTSNSIDGTMAPLNTGVKVYDTAGNPITELDHVTWTAGESFMVENTDYTFEDGTVTIINDEYAGRPIEIVGLGEVKAVLYVAPAASGDSTEPEVKELAIGYGAGRFTVATGRATYTFPATYGETKLSNPADLTLSVYTKGETESPLHTFQSSEITYDSCNFSVDLTDYVTFNEGSNFSDGYTELDFVLTYNDNGETKTSAVKTSSVQKKVANLNTAGDNNAYGYVGDCFFAKVDGVDAPLSGYSADNCPEVKVAALTFEGDPYRVEEELTSAVADEGENCKKYNFTSTQGQNAGFTVYFDYTQQQIRFTPSYGDYKVELTIGGTAYSVMVRGGLPMGPMPG